MKPLVKFVGAVLVGAFALLAPPAAQAQVGVNINVGVPAWGPQVPYGTQYYYIPEIDGYYDLYTQQYIVFQDGYWVPLPELYGYDPYQFHPVIVDYRGPQPWLQVNYYRQRYAYQPFRYYGPSRGYYNGGYGFGPSYGRPRYYDNRGGYYSGPRYDGRNNHNTPGGYSPPRNNPMPQPGGGYNPGQGPGNHGGFGGGQGGYGGGRGNQGPQGGGNGGGRGNGGGNHGGGHGRG